MKNQSSIKYAIATGHHLTSQVAEDILESGGNAFDAAVAAFLAMSITEPAMCSMMAGGFANIYTPEIGYQIIDFFAQTPIIKPETARLYDEIVVDFGESQEIFFAGPGSMAVAGAAAMVRYLVKHHCRMSLIDLISPAVALSRSGVELTPFQATDLKLLEGIFGLQESGRDIFFQDNGSIKASGDTIYMAEYRDFLESFARESADWVYRGEIAQSVARYCEDNGGYLTLPDFESYVLSIQKPFTFDLAGIRVNTPGLPSLGGGLLYLFGREIWTNKYFAQDQTYFPHLVRAFDLSTPYTKSGQKLFQHIYGQSTSESANIFPGGTSHFNIVDRWQNCISLSVSIGEGSGYFIPGTNIQMNNMLGETALMPNGLDSWTVNTRLSSMMCPTIISDQQYNSPLMLTGTGGATRIPFSLGQMLYNKYALDMTLFDAIHAPRMYKNDLVCYLESGIMHDHHELEVPKKIWPNLELLFGGTHTIDLDDGKAVGDSRREGDARVAYN